MPKHRGSVYTVVREERTVYGNDLYGQPSIIGVYATLQRADEVADGSAQHLRDLGAEDGDYRFTVQVSTYYDE